jgi:hypothetical protein
MNTPTESGIDKPKRMGLDSDNESAKNKHAVALGSLGGSRKSPAKAAASRENGKKGGRPNKAKAT